MECNLFIEIKDRLLNCHVKSRLDFLNRTESFTNSSEEILNCGSSNLENAVIVGYTVSQKKPV